ncbi:MAG: hypothetical protein JNG90_08110 [Planctomycetaceae bacterium]|nr:hypothetical protein [Planctomycetaceae bacterium]
MPATQETLQEYTDARGARLQIDRAQSVIRGVKILGLRSRNGRVYLPAALASAAPLYEGAKVNVNHPKGHPHGPRDYQDRIGTLRGVEVRPAAGLFGDLHLNPAHALAEQLLWDAEHAPENVGLSHNVQAQTARRGDEVVVEAILKVQGVDLVADPATTRGLFEEVESLVAPASAPHDLEGSSRPGAARGLSGAANVAEGASHALGALPPPPALHLGAVSAERDSLALELRELRAALARQRRRQQIRQLLVEAGLPDPDTCLPGERALVGPAFIESLNEATDEPALRELVRERTELVAAARRLEPVRSADPAGGARPRSREQPTYGSPRPAPTLDEFVRAITS